MTFRIDSAEPGRDDYDLARLLVWERGLAKYGADPEADLLRRVHKLFTEAEYHRALAYLAASEQDTDRLAAIEASLGEDATSDTAWLAGQLRTAWARLDELRDRIDNSGTLIDLHYMAEGINYVRGSRRQHELRDTVR
ncbi:hypothetical protein ACFY5H_33880 [Streptomyces sp. NPDC013012]|uniref:hypothetical protein n=1 Tax=Streptomyces sp. NPDC013012 TaxID=3364860 RepID=UPI0036B08E34